MFEQKRQKNRQNTNWKCLISDITPEAYVKTNVTIYDLHNKNDDQDNNEQVTAALDSTHICNIK